MRHLPPLVLAVLPLSGCGGGKEPAVAPPAAAEATEAQAPAEDGPSGEERTEGPAAEPAEAAGLPTTCKPTDDAKICLPPKGFVDRLCSDVWPNVALAMFAKGTPWTRGFVTRDTKAWNASGGAANDGMLKFDEEVLVLRFRAAPKDGVQITGMGGYDVLRWEGSCVTLATEEMTLSAPPKALAPLVSWRTLDDTMRESLRGSQKVADGYRDQKKECKGVTMGSVSKKCEQLTAKLSDAIVDHVRSGGGVAVPERLP